jgi:hypothetical protein
MNLLTGSLELSIPENQIRIRFYEPDFRGARRSPKGLNAGSEVIAGLTLFLFIGQRYEIFDQRLKRRNQHVLGGFAVEKKDAARRA